MIKALLYKDFNALKRYAKIMLVVAVVCSFLFKEKKKVSKNHLLTYKIPMNTI